MSSPHLNRKLRLETPHRIPDGAGGYSETWAILGEHWAEIKARTGRERDEAGVPVSTMGFRITVRAAPYGSLSRPTPGQRFREAQRSFLVKAVAENDPLGRYLICFAEEEVVV